jgi:lipopolysaccharide transport protein LptA
VSRAAIICCVAVWALPFYLAGQTSSPSATTATPKKSEKKEKAASPAKTGALLGPVANSNEPVTTEIDAENAFFDANKNIGIFNGHVKVADPRFTLQAEKLTVYISKGENQGLEKAIAEGNVAVVRDRPDPNGGPPTRAVGRSEQATYVAATGDVELRGTPRVQEGINTHIATSPETVMVVNQKGQLTTHGPSRTEIRQEPKTDDQKDENKNQKGEKKDKKDTNKKESKSEGVPQPSRSP